MKAFIQSFLLTATILMVTGGCSKNKEQPASKMSGELSHDSGSRIQEQNQPTQLHLPPNLLSVLQQEMQQVESGMQLLLDYLTRGEAQNAADIAMQIHDSFILKQSLSQEELQQLVSLLPTGFVHMDRAFHGYAKKLAEAAQQNDFAASIKIYGDMAQACVSCHAQYAAEKFPGFSRG